MKQHTMVAMIATNRRMEEAMPAKEVGLRGDAKEGSKLIKPFLAYFAFSSSPLHLAKYRWRMKVETAVKLLVQK